MRKSPKSLAFATSKGPVAAPRLPLLDLDALPDGRPLFEELTRTFWPGPLSIVAPARPTVPDEVTAATGFVAVRCPQHVVARQLVAAAGVPLAAPSANRFGHISPTRPEHVFEEGHGQTALRTR